MDARAIRKEARDIDWQALVKEAHQNALEALAEYKRGENDNEFAPYLEGIELDEEGKVTRIVGRVFLGTVFALYPSGKYYTPWANSNVDDCPQCHGSGTGALVDCPQCHGNGIRTYEDIAHQTGEAFDVCKARIDATWPMSSRGDDTTFWCMSCDGTGKVRRTCRFCHGLGSREAYEDEVYTDALEYYAGKVGGFIESGEGDPCDVFFGIWVDVKREQAKDTVKRFVKRQASFGELKAASRNL